MVEWGQNLQLARRTKMSNPEERGHYQEVFDCKHPNCDYSYYAALNNLYPYIHEPGHCESALRRTVRIRGTYYGSVCPNRACH